MTRQVVRTMDHAAANLSKLFLHLPMQRYALYRAASTKAHHSLLLFCLVYPLTHSSTNKPLYIYIYHTPYNIFIAPLCITELLSNHIYYLPPAALATPFSTTLTPSLTLGQ